jgi:hypothetical protein
MTTPGHRPKLAAALRLCRVHSATLVIAKLDRLSRDAHFLLGLEKAGVDFVAADMPHANRLTVGIVAMVADLPADLSWLVTESGEIASLAPPLDVLGPDASHRHATGLGGGKGIVRAAGDHAPLLIRDKRVLGQSSISY